MSWSMMQSLMLRKRQQKRLNGMLVSFAAESSIDFRFSERLLDFLNIRSTFDCGNWTKQITHKCLKNEYMIKNEMDIRFCRPYWHPWTQQCYKQVITCHP